MNAEEAYEISRELRQILKRRNVCLGDAEAIVCSIYGELLYNVKIEAAYSNEEVIEMAKLGLLRWIGILDKRKEEEKNGPN